MPSNLPAPHSLTLWTIGHSTRPWDTFLQLLSAHGISAIADVRRFPGSRRHPWFASEQMADTLPSLGVAYQWIPELGGRRRVQPASPNGAWENAAFQGYADHMTSAEFASGLEKALALAGTHRAALMCAEAPWWRCHRRLISDLLTHRGNQVLHIVSRRGTEAASAESDGAGGGAGPDLSARAGHAVLSPPASRGHDRPYRRRRRSDPGALPSDVGNTRADRKSTSARILGEGCLLAGHSTWKTPLRCT